MLGTKRDVAFNEPVPAQRVERSRLLPPREIGATAQPSVAGRRHARRTFLPDPHQLSGRGVRERLKQHAVYHGEGGRRCANAKRQRDERGGRESRRPAHRGQGEAYVLMNRAHERHCSGLAGDFSPPTRTIPHCYPRHRPGDRLRVTRRNKLPTLHGSVCRLHAARA
jgi:hypothetical protein